MIGTAGGFLNVADALAGTTDDAAGGSGCQSRIPKLQIQKCSKH